MRARTSLRRALNEKAKLPWEVAKFYTDDFLKGMKALNLLEPTHMPKATDYHRAATGTGARFEAKRLHLPNR